MPAGDGTGPRGMGAMTGRAAGFCAGYSTPGYLNPVPGRGAWGWGGGGRGFGRGGGRGFGRGRGWAGAGAYPAPYAAPPVAPPTPDQERDALRGQVKYLESALDDLRGRLAELETKQTKD